MFFILMTSSLPTLNQKSLFVNQNLQFSYSHQLVYNWTLWQKAQKFYGAFDKRHDDATFNDLPKFMYCLA